jgi:hypothetical protein
MNVALWESAVASAVRELVDRTVAFLPNVAASLGVVVLGWLVAWIAKKPSSPGSWRAASPCWGATKRSAASP